MGVIFFFNAQQVLITSIRLPFYSSNNITPTSNHHLLLKTTKSSSCRSSILYAAPPKDSKFVPLNDDDPSYGPPALLLLGFQPDEEASKIQQLLKDLDGDFMRIVYCTEAMLSESLWNAMHQQPNLQQLKIAKSLPRICIISGLTGEETLMFIHAFQDSGIDAAVFAALVPNNAHTPLHELIQEIMGDHEATMSAKQSSSP